MDSDETVIGGSSDGWQELPAGTVLGNYRIERLLGRGGMGAVYLAEHLLLNKCYAVKVLPIHLSRDASFRERFEAEGQRMASLDHPGIVPIHYSGESNGLRYFAMEYMAGGDLEQRLKSVGGRLPEGEVADILRQLLVALTYAHGNRVIHRDLKPANILLGGAMTEKSDSASPQVKIADFGLAQVVGDGYMKSLVEQTVAASMLGGAETVFGGRPAGSKGSASPNFAGTIHFMAPEVIGGGAATVQSDLYAVGVIGYYLLTGKRPIGKYRAASKLVDSLNSAWDDWLDNLMAGEVEYRTTTAQEALAALPTEGESGPAAPAVVVPAAKGRPVVKSPVSKRPPSTAVASANPLVKRSLLVIALALAITALLGVGGWVGYQWWQSQEALRLPGQAQSRQDRDKAEQRRLAEVAEQSKVEARTRATAESALGRGDLEVAGEVIAEMEASGFGVSDLRLRMESMMSAREVRARAGQAEAARQRWSRAVAEDSEGLETMLADLESAWLTSELARDEGSWSEALHSYEGVLEYSRRLEQLSLSRDQAREGHAALETMRERAIVSQAEAKAGDRWASASSLRAEGLSEYDAGNFADAAAIFTRSQDAYEMALKHAEAVLAWEVAGADWNRALAAVDVPLLEEWSSGLLGEARANARTAELNESDPQAGVRAYERAVSVLWRAEAEALEKSSPVVRVLVYLDGQQTAGIPVSVNGQPLTSGERMALPRNADRVTAEVGAFERGDMRYGGGRVEAAVDWRGVRDVELRLEEVRRPVPGQNVAVELPGGSELDLVWIAPGEFMMGSPMGEVGRVISSEGPHTRVHLSKGFWLGKTPVTQGQWQTLMGSNPSRFKGSGLDAPVESVSWNEAMEFARKLTERERSAGRLPEGYVYTLPSEAQWEYACRAGTSSRFFSGNSESDLARVGWYSANSGGKTHPVGQKEPNGWGLYDMHGNVFEWTRSWYGNYPGHSVTDYEGSTIGFNRVLRGGSWLSKEENCRSAIRYRNVPGERFYFVGFRLALVPSP